MLQEKYSSVLELGQALGVKNGDVQEVDGKLKVTGTCAYALDRDHLWDAITVSYTHLKLPTSDLV